MKCPKCQFDNPEGVKFCGECGTKLEKICPKCRSNNLAQFKFCGECGQDLTEKQKPEDHTPPSEGERKYVTVLFSDLSGYTAMSEKFDPEEVKEIMSRIFGEIAQVVAKYEGFIEKFVGDAVMALFGVPKAHEDDPVRAILAAREIHSLVEAMSPGLEERIGQPISTHTGINTGLVVTGEVNMEKGTHGVAGDTINLASRLTGVAQAGDTVVSEETFKLAQRFFEFEAMEPSIVKGKEKAVQAYKVVSAKEKPITIHRLSGMRANLIGRKAEIDSLDEAAHKLQENKEGMIIAICGEAGIGKSRLVEEFKASVDANVVRWIEGHAYAYSENTPYYPLVDMFNRTWNIKEGDPKTAIMEKLETNIAALLGNQTTSTPYIAILYGIEYPETREIDAEFWKSRLFIAVQEILSALIKQAPTVIFYEDLHWADPSSMELFRFILKELKSSALFVCAYRPTFTLLKDKELGDLGSSYREIQVKDLSSLEAEEMTEGLLQTRSIPLELKQFVSEKAEGNPFYLEEVVNSLIESDTLVSENGSWKLSRPISEAKIPLTIEGVISARLDRLEMTMKRVIQEASVIGRSFLYDILEQVTELKLQLDDCLDGLEKLDLIKTKSYEPNLEYIFKHALTQDVVYNGLLKKERHEIHERIGLIIEKSFHDRLSEFYETLAYHFRRSGALRKAVDYLMKSGEKAFNRSALDESYQYYKEAYDLLIAEPVETKEDKELLIELTNIWSEVYYYRADINGWLELLKSHEETARSLNDKAKLARYYAWMSAAFWAHADFAASCEYARSAIKLGEEVDEQLAIGYACVYLAMSNFELGYINDAIAIGERAMQISKNYSDQPHIMLHEVAFASLGSAHWSGGDVKNIFKYGKELQEFSHKYSNLRTESFSHFITGWGYWNTGDLLMAADCFQKAIGVVKAPWYVLIPTLLLGMSRCINGRPQEAKGLLQDVLADCEAGCEMFRKYAEVFLGVVEISEGNLSRGMKTIMGLRETWQRRDYKYRQVMAEYLLSNIYMNIIKASSAVSLIVMVRNIGFILNHALPARKKARFHLEESIRIAEEIGARNLLAGSYLELGNLNILCKRPDEARGCILKAIKVYEQCGAKDWLKKAKENLASLN